METLNLSGSGGNAYSLISKAKLYSNSMGVDCELIIDEMKSGDYQNLVKVFKKYFGHLIIIIDDNMCDI